VGLPGRVVDLLSTCASRETLLLALLTWVGTWFGRSVFTRFGGQIVWPNLFALMIGSPLAFPQALKLVRGLFEDLDDQFLTANTGITNGLSIVYPIRDSLTRSEKMFTMPGDPPQFSAAVVDNGETERRLLITDPSLGASLARKTQSSRSLHSALVAAFCGEDLASFMSYREGGFLRSSDPHVAVLSTCGRNQVLSIAQCTLYDTFIFGQEMSEPVFGIPDQFDKSAFSAVQADCLWALLEAAGEIRLDPVALELIHMTVRALPPSARNRVELKLVKVALIYAALDDAPRTITAKHVSAAVAVLRLSACARHASEAAAGQDQIAETAARIEEGLRRSQAGLSCTEISAIFSGNTKRDVLEAAKEKLLREHRAFPLFIRTGGRRKQIWRIRDTE
jgi:hypothetical protein